MSKPLITQATCPTCGRTHMSSRWFTGNGKARFYCKKCLGKRATQAHRDQEIAATYTAREEKAAYRNWRNAQGSMEEYLEYS